MNELDLLTYQNYQLQNQLSSSFSLIKQLCQTKILQTTSNILQLSQSKLKGQFYENHPLLNFEGLNQIILTAYNKEFKNKNRCLFQWLSIILFNIPAINEEHINQIQNYILQSTSIQNTHQYVKDKSAIQNLRIQLKQWVYNFLSMPALKTVIKSVLSQSNSLNKIPQITIFLQILDYISLKYKLDLSIDNQAIVQYVSNQPSIIQPQKQIIQFVNHYLFDNNIQPLIQLLNQNYNINQCNILKIIDANFVNTTRPRSLFKNTVDNGKKLIQNLINFMINKQNVDKNQMFNQKYYDQHRSFRFFMKILWNRYAHIPLKFVKTFIKNTMVQSLNISNSFRTASNNSKNTSKGQFLQENTHILKQVSSFFIFLVIEQPQFHSIMHFLHQKLSKKYGKGASFEIIKKVILNRFLLNPQIFAKYNFWDQQLKLKNFAQSANAIRILFYEKKVKQQNLSQNLTKISYNIRSQYQRFLQISPQNNNYDKNKTSLYMPDKMLYLCYDRLISQINWNSHQNSYSISFSFLKNSSFSKNNSVYSRSNVNSKKNQSNNYNQIKNIQQKNINLSNIPKFVSCHSSNEQSKNLIYLSNPHQKFNKQQHSIRFLIQQMEDNNKKENNTKKEVSKTQRIKNYIYKGKHHERQQYQEGSLPEQSFSHKNSAKNRKSQFIVLEKQKDMIKKQKIRNPQQKMKKIEHKRKNNIQHQQQRHNEQNNISHKNNAEMQTQLTSLNNLNQDQKFQQMVQLRRHYGEKKRILKNAFDDKEKKWKAKSSWFRCTNDQLKNIRRQIQRANASVKININIL